MLVETPPSSFPTKISKRNGSVNGPLVRIMKYGSKGDGSRANREAGATEFLWTPEKEVAFQTVKQAIVNNARAAPDPTSQYHWALDASKQELGGVLFQLVGIPPGVEATSSSSHREAETIIMFISVTILLLRVYATGDDSLSFLM